jgi:signal transduction histidine kinase
MGEDFANFLESPEIRLDRVLASWNGIIALETSIDRDLFSDPARGNLFVQLIEESIANSVRKGHATEVKIRATFTGSRLEIDINDNGHFDKSSKPGLGTAWLERYAVGESKIDATESGTRLTVEL